MRVFATSVNRPELQRRAVLFGFARFEDFQQWSRSATSLASEIESLAPALAGDGPNLVRDTATGLCKGVAFITFQTEQGMAYYFYRSGAYVGILTSLVFREPLFA